MLWLEDRPCQPSIFSQEACPTPPPSRPTLPPAAWTKLNVSHQEDMQILRCVGVGWGGGGGGGGGAKRVCGARLCRCTAILVSRCEGYP